MGMTNKSHGKTADRKRAEIHELEVQMARKFVCGGCHVGFDKKQDYEDHNSSEEHNYHIMRKINTLVPGLAFCAACSCVIQTAKGWASHIQTDKHARCTQSLQQCGVDGEYHEPLGCTSAGQIGLPIPTAQIDIKKATSHGYGHGGKMGAGIPIIGLDKVQFLYGVSYKCRVCMETFAFEHRGNHLGGNEHRLNYLRCNYPAWYMDVSSILPEHVMQIKFRLMFYAHKVEMTEKQTENSLSKVLRVKFASESTQRRPHNVGKDRSERGNFPRSYGNVVFVKEGENDVPAYVMRAPMPDIKKKAFNKNKGSWQQRKDREFLKNAQGDYSSGQIKAIVAGADSEQFAQGSKMVFKEKEKKLLLVTPPKPKDTGSEEFTVASSKSKDMDSTESTVGFSKSKDTDNKESTVGSSSLQAKSVAPSASEAAQSDPASAKEGDPYEDPAMQTAESATENSKKARDTKKDTEKGKPVMLMHSSRGPQQKASSSRGHPQDRGRGARGSHRPPRGGSPRSSGHDSRGRPPPARGQWDPYEDPAMMYDGYQLQEDCYEEPQDYGYDYHGDYDQNLGKRHPSQLMEYPPFKKHRASYQEDPRGSAEKALEVLEKFAKKRSQKEVFHSVQTMKREVYNQYSSEQEMYGYEEGYCEPEGPAHHPRMGRGRESSRGDFGPRFHGPPRGGYGPGRGFGPPRGFRHPSPWGVRGGGPRHPC